MGTYEKISLDYVRLIFSFEKEGWLKKQRRNRNLIYVYICQKNNSWIVLGKQNVGIDSQKWKVLKKEKYRRGGIYIISFFIDELSLMRS